MITAVAASPAVDVTYEVDELVLGRTHRPSAVHRRPGGKAVNLARAAAAVGGQAQVIAPLPGSAHGFFTEQLAEDGVRLHAVEVAAELRTCVSVASGDSGLMTEVYEHPVPLSDDDRARFVAAVQEHAVSGWVALSGAVPSLDLVRAVLDLGPDVAVDTSGPGLDAAVSHGPRLVKVNRDEAMTWLGEVVPVADVVVALQERTGGLVVVTDSVRGAYATDGDAVWHVGPTGERGRFPQGSGDSFLGGLLAALDRGAGLHDALRLATGCASANALVPGAGRFDPELAHALAERVEIRPAG